MVWNYLFLFSESLPNEPIKKLNFFFLVNNCVHATGSAFLLTIPSSWGSSAATGAVSSSTLTSASTDAPSAKSADIAPSVTWLHARACFLKFYNKLLCYPECLRLLSWSFLFRLSKGRLEGSQRGVFPQALAPGKDICLVSSSVAEPSHLSLAPGKKYRLRLHT